MSAKHETMLRKCAALFALYLFILWPMGSGTVFAATPDEAPPDDPFEAIQDLLAHGGTVTPEHIDRLNEAELERIIRENPNDFGRLLSAMDATDLGNVQNILDANQVALVLQDARIIGQLDLGNFNPAALAAAVNAAFAINTPGFTLTLPAGNGCRITGSSLSCTSTASIDLSTLGGYNAASGEGQIIGIALENGELRLRRTNAAADIILGEGIAQVTLRDGNVVVRGTAGEELTVEHGRVRYDGKYLLDTGTTVRVHDLTFTADGPTGVTSVGFEDGRVRFLGNGHFGGALEGSVLDQPTSSLTFTFTGDAITKIDGVQALFIMDTHRVSGDFSTAVQQETIEKRRADGSIERTVTITNLEVTLTSTGSYYEQISRGTDGEITPGNRVTFNGQPVTVHACGSAAGFSPLCGGSQQLVTALTEAKEFQQTANSLAQLAAAGDLTKMQELVGQRGITCADTASCLSAFQQLAEGQRAEVAELLHQQGGNVVFLSGDGNFMLSTGIATVDFYERMGEANFRRTFRGNDAATLGYIAMGDELIVDNYNPDTVENFASLDLEMGIQQLGADGQFTFRALNPDDPQYAARMLQMRFDRTAEGISSFVSAQDIGALQTLLRQMPPGQLLAVPDFRITPMDAVNSITFNRDATQAFLRIAKVDLDGGSSGVVAIGEIAAKVEEYRQLREEYQGLQQIAQQAAMLEQLTPEQAKRLQELMLQGPIDSYYDELIGETADLVRQLTETSGADHAQITRLIEANRLSASGDTRAALALYGQVQGSYASFAQERVGDIHLREQNFAAASTVFRNLLRALPQNVPTGSADAIRLKLLQSDIGASGDMAQIQANLAALLTSTNAEVKSQAQAAFGGYLIRQAQAVSGPQRDALIGQALSSYAAAIDLAQDGSATQRNLLRDFASVLGQAAGVSGSTDQLTTASFDAQLKEILANAQFAEQLRGLDTAQLRNAFVSAQLQEAANGAGSIDTRVRLLEESVGAQADFGNLMQLAQAYSVQGNLALAELTRQRAEQALNEQSRESRFAYSAGREEQRVGVKLFEAQLRFADAQGALEQASRSSGGTSAAARQEAEQNYAEALRVARDIIANYDANSQDAHGIMVQVFFSQGNYHEAAAGIGKTSAEFQNSEMGKLLASPQAMVLLEAAQKNRQKVADQQAGGRAVDNFAIARAEMQELEARKVAGITLSAEQQTRLMELRTYVQQGDVNYIIQQVGSALQGSGAEGGTAEERLRSAIALIAQRRAEFPEYAAALEQQETSMHTELGIREAYASGDAAALQAQLAAAPPAMREQFQVLEADLLFRNALAARDPAAARVQLDRLRATLPPEQVAQLEQTVAALEAVKEGSLARQSISAYLDARGEQEAGTVIPLPADAARYMGDARELISARETPFLQQMGIDARNIYMDPATGKLYQAVTRDGVTEYREIDPNNPQTQTALREAQQQEVRAAAQREQQMLAALRELDPEVLQQLAGETTDANTLAYINAVLDVKQRVEAAGGDLTRVSTQLAAELAAAQQANSGIGQIFRIGEDDAQAQAERLMQELDAQLRMQYSGLSDAELAEELYQAQLARSGAQNQRAVAGEGDDVPTWLLLFSGNLNTFRGILQMQQNAAERSSTEAELIGRQHREQVLRDLLAAREITAEAPGLMENNPELFAAVTAQRSAQYALEGFSATIDGREYRGDQFGLNGDAAFLNQLDPNNRAAVQLRFEREAVLSAIAQSLQVQQALLPTIEDPALRDQLRRDAVEMQVFADQTARDIRGEAADAFLERSVERADEGFTGYMGAISDLGLMVSIRGIFGGIDAELDVMNVDRSEAQLREIQTRRALDVLAETGMTIEEFQSGTVELEALVAVYNEQRVAEGKEPLTEAQQRAVRNDLLATQRSGAFTLDFDPTQIEGMAEEHMLDHLFNMRDTAAMMAVSGVISQATKAVPGILSIGATRLGGLAARSTTTFGQTVFGLGEAALGGASRGIQAAAASNWNVFNLINKADEALMGAAQRAGLGTVQSSFGRAMKNVLTETLFEEYALPSAVGGALGQHASDSLDLIETAAGLRGRGSINVRLTQSVDVRGNAFTYVSVDANPLTYARQTLGPNAQIEAVSVVNGEIVATPGVARPQAVRITEPSGATMVIAVSGGTFDQQQLRIHDDSVRIQTATGDIRVLTAEGPDLVQRLASAGTGGTTVEVLTANGERLSGVLIEGEGGQRLIVSSPTPANQLQITRVESRDRGVLVENPRTVVVRDQIAESVEQLLASGNAPTAVAASVRQHQASLLNLLQKDIFSSSLDPQLWRSLFTTQTGAAQQYAAEILNAIKNARDARGLSTAFEQLQALGVLNDAMKLQISDPTLQEFVETARPQVIAFRAARQAAATRAAAEGAEAASVLAAAGDQEGARAAAELTTVAEETAEMDAAVLAHIDAAVVTADIIRLRQEIDALNAELARNLDDREQRREIGAAIHTRQRQMEALEEARRQMTFTPELRQQRVVELQREIDARLAEMALNPYDATLRSELGREIAALRAEMQQHENALRGRSAVTPPAVGQSPATLESPIVAEEQRQATVERRVHELEQQPFDTTDERAALEAELRVSQQREALARQLAEDAAGDIVREQQTTQGDAIVALDSASTSEERIAAIQQVPAVPTPQAADVLIGVLEQSGPVDAAPELAFAADALGQVAAVSDGAIQARAIAALSEVVLHSPDPLARQAAANALRMIGTLDAVAVLARGTQDTDAVVRETAVRAVGDQLGMVEEEIDALATQVQDPAQADDVTAELEATASGQPELADALAVSMVAPEPEPVTAEFHEEDITPQLTPENRIGFHEVYRVQIGGQPYIYKRVGGELGQQQIAILEALHRAGVTHIPTLIGSVMRQGEFVETELVGYLMHDIPGRVLSDAVVDAALLDRITATMQEIAARDITYERGGQTHQVFHGDLRTLENILVTPEGEFIIIDWGGTTISIGSGITNEDFAEEDVADVADLRIGFRGTLLEEIAADATALRQGKGSSENLGRRIALAFSGVDLANYHALDQEFLRVTQSQHYGPAFVTAYQRNVLLALAEQLTGVRSISVAAAAVQVDGVLQELGMPNLNTVLQSTEFGPISLAFLGERTPAQESGPIVGGPQVVQTPTAIAATIPNLVPGDTLVMQSGVIWEVTEVSEQGVTLQRTIVSEQQGERVEILQTVEALQQRAASIAEIRRAEVSEPATSGTPTVELPEQYEILETLGTGHYGTVYLVRDTTDGTVKALKVVQTDGVDATTPEAVAQEFNIQQQVYNALRGVQADPAVVRVDSVQHLQGSSLIVMEQVQGGTLEEMVHGEGPTLSIAQRVQGARDLATALATMHGLGYLHLDIKPENILVRLLEGRMKLGDFGLAKTVAEASASEIVTVSSPLWSDMRMWTAGKPDAAADVYSLGVTLYYLFSGGSHPFFDMQQLKEKSLDDIMQGLVEGSISIRIAPPAPIQSDAAWAQQLNALLLQMVSVDETSRPTAAEVAKTLDGIVAELAAESPLMTAAREAAALPSRTLEDIAAERREAKQRFTDAVADAQRALEQLGATPQVVVGMSLGQIAATAGLTQDVPAMEIAAAVQEAIKQRFANTVTDTMATLVDLGLDAQQIAAMDISQIAATAELTAETAAIEIATAVKFQASREVVHGDLRNAGIATFIIAEDGDATINALTDALALLNTHSRHYQDAREIAQRMPSGRARVAALLHDIGKVGPPTASSSGARAMVEVSERTSSADYLLQAQSAGIVLELYGLSTNINPAERETITIAEFLSRVEVSTEQRERLLTELGKLVNPFTGKPFAPTDPMVSFWRAHPVYDVQWLNGKVSAEVVDIAASHHLTDNVGGIAVNPRGIDLTTMDPTVRTDLFRLMAMDKFDAFVHRAGLPVDAAAAATTDLLMRSPLLAPYRAEIEAVLAELSGVGQGTTQRGTENRETSEAPTAAERVRRASSITELERILGEIGPLQETSGPQTPAQIIAIIESVRQNMFDRIAAATDPRALRSIIAQMIDARTATITQGGELNIRAKVRELLRAEMEAAIATAQQKSAESRAEVPPPVAEVPKQPEPPRAQKTPPPKVLPADILDFYARLGIPPTATPKEIRDAYRRLSRDWHSDSSMYDVPVDVLNRQFGKIAEAYQTLSDPAKRQEYDRSGQQRAQAEAIRNAQTFTALEQVLRQVGSVQGSHGERYTAAQLIEIITKVREQLVADIRGADLTKIDALIASIPNRAMVVTNGGTLDLRVKVIALLEAEATQLHAVREVEEEQTATSRGLGIFDIVKLAIPRTRAQMVTAAVTVGMVGIFGSPIALVVGTVTYAAMKYSEYRVLQGTKQVQTARTIDALLAGLTRMRTVQGTNGPQQAADIIETVSDLRDSLRRMVVDASDLSAVESTYRTAITIGTQTITNGGKLQLRTRIQKLLDQEVQLLINARRAGERVDDAANWYNQEHPEGAQGCSSCDVFLNEL